MIEDTEKLIPIQYEFFSKRHSKLMYFYEIEMRDYCDDYLGTSGFYYSYDELQDALEAYNARFPDAAIQEMVRYPEE